MTTVFATADGIEATFKDWKLPFTPDELCDLLRSGYTQGRLSDRPDTPRTVSGNKVYGRRVELLAEVSRRSGWEHKYKSNLHYLESPDNKRILWFAKGNNKVGSLNPGDMPKLARNRRSVNDTYRLICNRRTIDNASLQPTLWEEAESSGGEGGSYIPTIILIYEDKPQGVMWAEVVVPNPDFCKNFGSYESRIILAPISLDSAVVEFPKTSRQDVGPFIRRKESES